MKTRSNPSRSRPRTPSRLCTLPGAIAIGAAVLAAGCATVEKEGPPRQEVAYGITTENRLIQFNAGQPSRLLMNAPVAGLATGEKLLAIDFRGGPRHSLYGLGSTGQLYTIDVATATARPVGSGIRPSAFAVDDIGFDFNPAVDRIRLVSGDTNNLRIDPDSGAIVDADPQRPELQIDAPLAYAPGDAHAGRVPRVQAAAYTHNRLDPKLTTNYAIDAANQTLVTQGSLESVTPAVSPNTGLLFTVGRLDVGSIRRVSLDVADRTNAAFLAVTPSGGSQSDWYLLDLASGGTVKLGRIGIGEPLVGIAVE